MSKSDDFINTVTANQFSKLSSDEKHNIACELTRYDEDENIPNYISLTTAMGDSEAASILKRHLHILIAYYEEAKDDMKDEIIRVCQLETLLT